MKHVRSEIGDPEVRAAGVRDAEATRARLLDVAFSEIYQHGYQGLRVDALLAMARLTKGAFYHHFPSKTALGIAVIDELLAGFAEPTTRVTLIGLCQRC